MAGAIGQIKELHRLERKVKESQCEETRWMIKEVMAVLINDL
jgi:hypothetical protein